VYSGGLALEEALNGRRQTVRELAMSLSDRIRRKRTMRRNRFVRIHRTSIEQGPILDMRTVCWAPLKILGHFMQEVTIVAFQTMPGPPRCRCGTTRAIAPLE